MDEHLYSELQATQILLARLITQLQRDGHLDRDWLRDMPSPLGLKSELSFSSVLPRIAMLVDSYHHEATPDE